MEIKKSKKLLSALIATSFVGIAITPVVLTSCSKKEKSFDEFVKNNVKLEVKNVKKNGSAVENSSVKLNDENVIVVVVGDDKGDCDEFELSLTLPVPENEKDDNKKVFKDKVSCEVTSNNAVENKNFVEPAGEPELDKDKKVKTFKFKINKNISIIKDNNAKSNESATGCDTKKWVANNTYSTLSFKFTNAKKADEVYELKVKVTLDEKK